ncbi:MAG: beta-L-arabinofuranosidase domain-containing protein [Limisphaerales bacterium]
MNSPLIRRREFLKEVSLIGAAAWAAPALIEQRLNGATERDARAPSCDRIPGTRFHLEGPLRNYFTGVSEQWLKVAPLSNPAMLDMFRDRDRRPLREQVPWAGEFAGKYLTSAVQVWRVTGDPALKRFLSEFVARLVVLQADDGYLGPWPRENRLTGHAPNLGATGGDTWDAWGHYHILIGLLLWHEDTGDAAALACARRIGDLFCKKFETTRLVDTGSTEMNLAPIHALCRLYRRTEDRRYLKLALKICDEFAATDPAGKPLAGDYLNAALAGKEFFQMPKPRWESLHPIMGLTELFWISGDERYRRAFEQIWWSIVKLDRHNNGGFSSGEQAQGNPYHQGAIETCCTIAWIALSVEMLRLTGDSIVADEIELSTLNSVVGLHSPTGRWVTYNTPMDGTRKASAHDIVFQARAGSPELNCCSVNGARGFGMISDWALMASGDGLILNWYGPSTMTARLASGIPLELTQETDYPQNNRVRLRVAPGRPVRFALKLRIPHWSRTTRVKLNGLPVEAVPPGRYLALDRTWKRGDTVEVEFDFSLHFWAGQRECANKVSVYRGPILLTYDRRFNEMDPDQVPSLDAAALSGKRVASGDWLPPMLLLEFAAADGRPVRLCDFGSAGSGGSPYRSWLDVKGISGAEFSRANPLRTCRLDHRP